MVWAVGREKETQAMRAATAPPNSLFHSNKSLTLDSRPERILPAKREGCGEEGAESMSRESFRIGEIAAQAEVSIDTVRFYERRHLLPRAHRTRGGFRLFPPETVERIRFIRQAQDVGLSLDEIESILTVGGGVNECRRISTLLTSKLTVLEARIKAMQDFRKRLVQHLKACEDELNKQGTGTKCPVIKEITSSAQASPSPKRRRKDAS